jgi:hypothetical protein
MCVVLHCYVAVPYLKVTLSIMKYMEIIFKNSVPFSQVTRIFVTKTNRLMLFICVSYETHEYAVFCFKIKGGDGNA